MPDAGSGRASVIRRSDDRPKTGAGTAGGAAGQLAREIRRPTRRRAAAGRPLVPDLRARLAPALGRAEARVSGDAGALPPRRRRLPADAMARLEMGTAARVRPEVGAHLRAR